MDTALPHWERPHFAPGGGDPFLQYLVYGDIQLTGAMDRTEYRSEGPPEGMEVMSYNANEHADVVDYFRSEFIWNQFKKENAALAKDVKAQDTCMMMRGTPAEDSSLDYMRDAVGVITYLLDQGGIAVCDPWILKWWSADEWREEIFDHGEPKPGNHVVILTTEEEDNRDLTWFHTRGMRKFGRPDISVRGIPEKFHEGAVELCNRLIEHQAHGMIVEDGQEVHMKSLPDGGVIRLQGDLDDVDFNNVHLDIRWPGTTLLDA